jgi:hypothetical protein
VGVFTSYTLRSLRKNRTRTVVTVVGVILSTALLTGVVATATSIAAALLGRTIETEGSWQVYDDLQPAEADSALGRLTTDANVTAAMDSQVAGFASYASDANLSTTLLAIQTAPRVLRGSESQARGLTVMPTVRSGREPEARKRGHAARHVLWRHTHGRRLGRKRHQRRPHRSGVHHHTAPGSRARRERPAQHARCHSQLHRGGLLRAAAL